MSHHLFWEVCSCFLEMELVRVKAISLFLNLKHHLNYAGRFRMEKKNDRYGVCGVYCGQCPNGNGRVKMMAGELKRLVDTVRYDWMDSVIKSFRFKEFRKGLEWFANAQCPMCLKRRRRALRKQKMCLWEEVEKLSSLRRLSHLQAHTIPA